MDKQEIDYEREFAKLLKELPEEKKKELLYILYGYMLSEEEERKRLERLRKRLL